MLVNPLVALAMVPVLQRIEFSEREGRLVLRLGGLDMGDFKFISGEVSLGGEVPEEERGRARTELLGALQKGPLGVPELSRMSQLGEAAVLQVMGQLEREGRVSAFPLRVPGGWASLYALPQHASRAAEESGFERRPEVPRPLREAILEGVDRLRRELFRNPDVEEVARELERDPEEPAFRQAVYQVAGGAGWRPPTPREREEARRKLDYIPALAKLLKSGITPSDASLEEINRAREHLEGRDRRALPELRA